MNQAIEIANINARFMRKEITYAKCIQLIFEIREKYSNLIHK